MLQYGREMGREGVAEKVKLGEGRMFYRDMETGMQIFVSQKGRIYCKWVLYGQFVRFLLDETVGGW